MLAFIKKWNTIVATFMKNVYFLADTSWKLGSETLVFVTDLVSFVAFIPIPHSYRDNISFLEIIYHIWYMMSVVHYFNCCDVQISKTDDVTFVFCHISHLLMYRRPRMKLQPRLSKRWLGSWRHYNISRLLLKMALFVTA